MHINEDHCMKLCRVLRAAESYIMQKSASTMIYTASDEKNIG